MRIPWRPSSRSWRRLVQVVCLVGFLWIFRRTEYDGFREIPAAADLLFRLDPVVAASTMLAAREIVVSLLLPAAALLILTFVLGRAFCGWVCPVGTLLDGARWAARPFARRASAVEEGGRQAPRRAPATEGPSPSPTLPRNRPFRWRRVKFLLLAVILAAALFGLPLAGYLDPFSIFFRGLAFAADPLLSEAVGAPFDWLYRNAPRAVTDVSESIYASLKGTLLPLQTHAYLLGGVSLMLLGGIFALELAGRRFWCRSVCPVGAALSIPARWSLLRRRPFKSCKACRLCESECRMESFDADGRMAPEDCNVCMDCVTDCPHGAATFRFSSARVPPAPFDPTRRALLGAAGVGLALSVAARLEGKALAASGRRPLRPPGAPEEEAFLDRCVRCGLCMKICPTAALHPAGLDGSWQGLFAPRMVPRLGYCEYDCTLCGEVCPTGAIPRLTKAEKHAAIIGKAEFDRDRCLPYARGEACIVCEEHCPLPEKAIQAREVEATRPDGTKVKLLEPYVVLERCTGCGICETKCPILGAAGIRILHTQEAAVTEEMAAGKAAPGDLDPY